MTSSEVFQSVVSFVREKGFFRFFISRPFCLALIGAGIVLRAKHYVDNNSFWFDEAWVAVDLLGRTFREVLTATHVAAYRDSTPYGFALMEKIAVTFLGNNEYVFRLFPQICGSVSIFLFYSLLKKYISPKAVPVALGFFVLCYAHIYYSAILKQYSTDVCAGLLLFWLAEKISSGDFNGRRILLFNVFGGLVLWISNAALFILASIWVVSVGENFRQRKMEAAWAWCKSGFLWMASFIVLHTLILANMMTNKDMYDDWASVQRPDAFISLAGLLWLKGIISGAFSFPANFQWPFVGLILFLLGAVALWQRDRKVLVLFLLPIALTLIAAILRKYHFAGRLIVFLLPYFFMIIAEGVVYLLEKLKRIPLAFRVIMVGLLFFSPVTVAIHNMRQGYDPHHNREMIQHFLDNYRPGDYIFSNFTGVFPFLYYERQLGPGQVLKNLIVQGEDEVLRGFEFVAFHHILLKNKTGEDFAMIQYYLPTYNQEGFFRRDIFTDDRMRREKIFRNTPFGFFGAKRAWLFMSCPQPDLTKFLLEKFSQNARCLKKWEKPTAALYLFEVKE